MIEEIIENMSEGENDANASISKWREIKKTGQKVLAGVAGVVFLWTSIYTVQPEALGIYAEAYSSDPDFYNFLKTLELYKKSLEGSKLIIGIDNPLLNLLNGEETNREESK